jgi:hypothetical protein
LILNVPVAKVGVMRWILVMIKVRGLYSRARPHTCLRLHKKV